MATSFVFWIGYIYISLTKPVPKTGGEYIEGMIGQPLYINPLLSQTNETDADLTQLIYSGLFKYGNEGRTIPDLADSFEVSEDQKKYTVRLRDNIRWHDGERITAEDIVFTYNLLADPMYKSPLRQNLQGIEIKEIDEKTVEFVLKNAYSGFLDNLIIGILPKHVWENITADKFSLAQANLKPIGSGPYAFDDFQKDTSGNILAYKLVANKDYYGGAPYISKLTFNFYDDVDALITAFNKKEVMGISSIDPEKLSEIKSEKNTVVNELAIPRYFALFLNEQKSVVLADEKVRKALSIGVDKNEIINEVLKGKGSQLSSPFLPQMKEYNAEANLALDVENAKKILEENGWKIPDGDSVRSKNGTRLSFEIVTVDWPQLMRTAEILKNQWAQIGVEVNIKPLTVSDIQQNYIRTREYDSLLFGQALSFDPDLYSFWHSSQKKDPGLNLAGYDNQEADKLLEDIRVEFEMQNKIEKNKQFQSLLNRDGEIPAIFLYSPSYLYLTNRSVHGNEIRNINSPSQRFSDINKWYVKTSRVFK